MVKRAESITQDLPNRCSRLHARGMNLIRLSICNSIAKARKIYTSLVNRLFVSCACQ